MHFCVIKKTVRSRICSSHDKIQKGEKNMNCKDPKGRVLRKGEGYRKDKNLYIYQYRDPLGGMHTLYANNIIETGIQI